MVAISLLMLALIAPMSLAAESLTAAYYSRSQITAFYLAQEGIEVVRSVRDANVLAVAESGSASSVFSGIPYGTTSANAPAFTVDALQASNNALYTCAAGGCPPLMTNGSLYGYDDNGSAIGPDCPYVAGAWAASSCQNGNGWTNTGFTRTIKAYLVNSSDPNELRVSVTIRWTQGSLQSQTFTINEDLYAWINGS